MPITFDFFTRKVRDVGGPDIEALTPEQRTAFKAVETALAERERLTEQLAETQRDTKMRAFLYDDARLALLHLQPQDSVAVLALAEKRRMTLPPAERQRLARLPIDPAITAAIEAASDSLRVFEDGKKKLREIQSALSDAGAVVSAKILKFQSTFKPISEHQLRRDYINAEQSRRAAGQAPARDEPVILAAVDGYMRGGKLPVGMNNTRAQNRHPDGAGKVYPQSMQGMRVAPPKVASWQVKARGTV